jgi:hypothetical protein
MPNVMLMPDRAQIARFTEFVLLQGLSRFLSLFQGLLVIHLITKSEYGHYALLIAVVMATANIAICGVGMFISSAGGRSANDPTRMASIFASARSVQRWLMIGGLLIVALLLPLQYHNMGMDNHLVITCLTLLALLMMVLHARSTLCRELLSINLHLRANQVIDLIGNGARLALIGALYAGGVLNLISLLIVVIVVSAISVAVQEQLIRRWILAGVAASASPQDRTEARRVILPQLPNAAYSSIQDQVPYLLMSILGTVQHIAEFAAMARIGLIFAFLFDVLSNFFMPRIARCQEPKRLKHLIVVILSGYYLVVLVSLGVAYLFGEQLVWLLGRQYLNVVPEIPLMLTLIGVQAISGSLFAINSSRAWMGHSWLFIISTISSQALVIPLLRLDTLHGMLLFAITPHLPFIVINAIFIVRGLRRTTHDLQTRLVS